MSVLMKSLSALFILSFAGLYVSRDIFLGGQTNYELIVLVIIMHLHVAITPFFSTNSFNGNIKLVNLDAGKGVVSSLIIMALELFDLFSKVTLLAVGVFVMWPAFNFLLEGKVLAFAFCAVSGVCYMFSSIACFLHPVEFNKMFGNDEKLA